MIPLELLQQFSGETRRSLAYFLYELSQRPQFIADFAVALTDEPAAPAIAAVIERGSNVPELALATKQFVAWLERDIANVKFIRKLMSAAMDLQKQMEKKE